MHKTAERALAQGFTHQVSYVKVFLDGGPSVISLTYHASAPEAEAAANGCDEEQVYRTGDLREYRRQAWDYGPIGGNSTVLTPSKRRIERAVAQIKANLQDPAYVAEMKKRQEETERGVQALFRNAQVDYTKLHHRITI